jgi:hypothetical protein
MLVVWIISGIWVLCGICPWLVASSRGPARNPALFIGVLLGPLAFAFVSSEPVISKEADLLFMRGVVRQNQNQYREAIQDLERAVALCPWHRFAHYALACCCVHMQLKEEALGHLAAAVSSGFNTDLIDCDAELMSIRQLPEYRQFVANRYTC